MERNTKQKELVIEYLKKHSDKHMTIVEIQKGLKNKVPMTTLYRIINHLIQKGFVIKKPFENKQGACYKFNDKEEKCDNHYHLICEKCNKLLHYESEVLEEVEKQIKKDKNFDIDNSKVVFYGICKECKGEN